MQKEQEIFGIYLLNPVKFQLVREEAEKKYKDVVTLLCSCVNLNNLG